MSDSFSSDDEEAYYASFKSPQSVNRSKESNVQKHIDNTTPNMAPKGPKKIIHVAQIHSYDHFDQGIDSQEGEVEEGEDMDTHNDKDPGHDIWKTVNRTHRKKHRKESVKDESKKNNKRPRISSSLSAPEFDNKETQNTNKYAILQ